MTYYAGINYFLGGILQILGTVFSITNNCHVSGNEVLNQHKKVQQMPNVVNYYFIRTSILQKLLSKNTVERIRINGD